MIQLEAGDLERVGVLPTWENQKAIELAYRVRDILQVKGVELWVPEEGGSQAPMGS